MNIRFTTKYETEYFNIYNDKRLLVTTEYNKELVDPVCRTLNAFIIKTGRAKFIIHTYIHTYHSRWIR
jgi:hypothetical protein